MRKSSVVFLSGMIETPRLQARQIFHCREATCHFPTRGESSSTVIPAKAGIQESWGCVFWMPDQVRHDTIVDFSQSN